MVEDAVVIDTSLALKWVLEEELALEARALLRDWQEAGMSLVAPHLLMAEAANALHRRVLRGEFATTEATTLLHNLITGDIEFIWTPIVSGRALALAAQLSQGAVYDAHYLALAEALDCEMWTADTRFYRSLQRNFERVRLLAEA